MTELAEGQKWFYAHERDAEVWQGPYDTREQAIADAFGDTYEPAIDDPVVYVCVGDQTSMEDALSGMDEYMVEFIGERLDEYLSDNAMSGEDPLVSFPDPIQALEGLRTWAGQYMKVERWWSVDGQDAEEVRNPLAPPDAADVVIAPVTGNIVAGVLVQESDGLNPEEADAWDEPSVG